MSTIYISRTISQASSIEEVVEAINAGGMCEGMEGVEFSPEQLAGQYAEDAASDSGFPVDLEAIEAHLEFLSDAGAVFNSTEAAEWGMKIASARDE